ncbi:hypothetical protein AA0120_g10083 [Alternaria tenuissima]|nr:hypothetical protein AA0120_g10083 [Alternaria tenuissima]
MFASITFDFRALEPIVDPAAILTLGSFEAIVVGSKLVWYVSNAMGYSGGYPGRFKSLQKVYWGTLQSPIKLFWRRGSGGVVTL